MNYNLSDLSEKIKWAHENQQIVSAIADHAVHTVKILLRKEDIEWYGMCIVYYWNIDS